MTMSTDGDTNASKQLVVCTEKDGMDKLESILAKVRDFEAQLPDYAEIASRLPNYTEMLAQLPDYAEIASRLPNYTEMLVRQPDLTQALSRFTRDMEALARSIDRAERRRKKLEDAVAKDNRCKRKGCTGRLEVKDRTYQDTVVGSSLVCSKCNYRRLDSPEYARCLQAEDFLEAAEKLGGKPPLSASYSAYQACELYLRELGGSYYYPADDDAADEEPDFVPPSSKHSLRTLRGRMEKSRRERLDDKQLDDESFRGLQSKLPEGLWPLLRYGEDHLKFHGSQQTVKASIGNDGRLYTNEVDVYSTLVKMARVMKKFVAEEFRRNRE